MNHNADDIPRSENDRRVATYHSFGQSNLDDEREGRYAAAGTRPAVTGSSPIAYPQQPSTSPWHSEPIGTEPPLGYDINAQDAVGEPFEVAASSADAGPTPPSVISRQDGGEVDDRAITSGSPVIRSKFVRRI